MTDEPWPAVCGYCQRPVDDHGVWALFECVEIVGRDRYGVVTRLRSCCDLTFPG